MVVESSSMATKIGKEEVAEVELELCLSLGGPFKKTEKAQPLEFRTDSKPNAVRCVEDIDVDLDDGTAKHEINATRRKEREAKEQRRSGGEGECKRIRTECKEVSSSSDVSDPSSCSRQEGGSCEFGINSGQTKLVESPINNFPTGIAKNVRSTDSQNDVVVVETQERSNSLAKETGKPPKPRPNGNGSMLPFAQMPCVTSTGNGPQGKTVNGFLHRYTKSEISIICVCHGTSFSPAEFIIHAGGTNVSHPLRHITVVPSKF
ncbi:PREDICTED: ninja-family protein AFP3-like [Brassica oleracea var. oleracea]|uniref:Ninja-family protein n=1 Tax=Brassica oleracea var. oleracea TaxID=109376 RepID=A0A0D3AF68_BRAOL|nr:PREDICTED: ninja-family protein AFP3-like [Brassica oleracea var. oleracea]